MDLHHLWLFYKVAQNLSFTKTAEELYISQPTVSVQVKKLEEGIGLKLIEKYGKNIYLTQYGQLVYKYADRIFGVVEEMESEISALKGSMSGKLNIGASNTPGTYIIPRIIGVFREKYPEVKNILHIGSTHEIQNKLMDNQVDFAVVGGNVELPKSFHIEKLMDDCMVIIVNPSHPLASQEYITPDELNEQALIAHEVTSNLYDAMEYFITKDLRLPMKVSMTLGSVDAIKHAIYANLGISLVPLCSVKQDIQLGLLSMLKVKDRDWRYPYNLVYHKDKNITLPFKRMVETIKKTMKEETL